MQQQNINSAPAGITPKDILYILFRRKWLILAFTLLGLVSGGTYFLQATYNFLDRDRVYSSEAKLFIRYILDKKLPGTANDSQIREPDSRGNNIIASEMQILASYDLALDVARKLGPKTILAGKQTGEATEQAAARKIAADLDVELQKNSDVLKLIFKHSDRETAQTILKSIIESYLKKHEAIHRASGLFDEALNTKASDLREAVNSTDMELRKIRTKTGILSLEDSKRAYTDELSRVRQEMIDTEAELAERVAAYKAMTEGLSSGKTNQTTNTTVQAAVSQEIVNQYRALLMRLDNLRKTELDYSQKYTSETLLVKANKSQIADEMQKQAKMEAEYPSLISHIPASVGRNSSQGAAPAFDPTAERARIAALEAKRGALTNLLVKIREEINAFQEVEPELLKLQRKREVDEAQYRQFSASLEQVRFDASLGAGRLSNISIAQEPTIGMLPPEAPWKGVAIFAIAGLVFGVALAFLLEMYLVPSVKTAPEMERKFRTQVFLSIPKLSRNGAAHKSKALIPEKADSGKSKEKSEKESSPDSQVVLWEPGSRMQVYCEGLRDRVMTWFDTRGIVKKPKLVAVTSCGQGAGVSSIAAGLASTFSETGDGRVLLVDMNVGQGAAHSFYKGQPGLGLDEALEGNKRNNAQVNENLYVVSEGSDNHSKLPSVLPRRFTNLVPKLKASDFDYIIFDMPPVSPITMTPRLSAYMDMVLLVVEAEKTSPQAVKEATGLLSNSKANVAAVLNKTNPDAPKWLQA